jgi:hypothetical protein
VKGTKYWILVSETDSVEFLIGKVTTRANKRADLALKLKIKEMLLRGCVVDLDDNISDLIEGEKDPIFEAVIIDSNDEPVAASISPNPFASSTSDHAVHSDMETATVPPPPVPTEPTVPAPAPAVAEVSASSTSIRLKYQFVGAKDVIETIVGHEVTLLGLKQHISTAMELAFVADSAPAVTQEETQTQEVFFYLMLFAIMVSVMSSLETRGCRGRY